jgi:hypothetical protein
VDIIQNLTVGASLGQDSINKGIYSGLARRTLMVVLFMIVYYRLSGIIANISLVLNILLLFVALAMLGSTLTLPGIAGIILSIGMAVDANILIYERMRDEFALGKSVRSGRGRRLQQGLLDHCRRPGHHPDHRPGPVPVRHRADQRVCHHPDPGYPFQPVCRAVLLRLMFDSLFSFKV